MNVTGIGPVQRTAAAAPSTEDPTALPSVRVASSTEVASTTGQPPPLRFPWLNRLSSELQAAARQIAPFAPAPVVGDNLTEEA
jgi:hypothetical protein